MGLGKSFPGSGAAIKIISSIVSRKHGEFLYDARTRAYYYRDDNSTNGTFLNGELLPAYNAQGTRAYRLTDGDILRIDHRDTSHPHPEAVLILYSQSIPLTQRWQVYSLAGLRSVSIGRDETNQLQLEDPMASREHAEIMVTNQGIALVDKNSTNGVFLDGKRINKSALLRPGSVIRIANTVVIFDRDRLVYNCAQEGSGHLAVQIVARRAKEKTIIQDIQFEADAEDFILILGGSGAGKTTLIISILGETRAEGRIMLDGQNLYDNFKSMKSRIGLVPQFVNLRENDKVYSTLMDIADYKLDGYSRKEKKERVDKILKMLGITDLRNHLIRQLSGGQKKKVAVAAQMVGFQKVFILDEPDSGLDPASRIQQMEILKEIAEAGKIVMVVSHASEEGIDFDTGHYRFTKVLVLAKNTQSGSGELAFYGSPEEALQFFGVRSLKDIIIEINPANEGGKGKSDYYIYKYKERMMR